MKPCKDCVAEGVTTIRPAPHPGPRCATHHRARRAALRQAAKERRVEVVYGITPEEYDAIVEAQGGVCPICLQPFVRKRGSVDHDHAIEAAAGTRASVRGVIHGWENTIIGRFRDDPARFDRIADYLRNPPARAVLDSAGLVGYDE